jgi:glycerol uptake facilitator-like aquaporin
MFIVQESYKRRAISESAAKTGVNVRCVILAAYFGRSRFSLPWGLRQRCRIPPAQRSGAHLNPSVTLTFLCLGQVKAWDALVFILVQFAAGGRWTHAWAYYTAPMRGMRTAVFLHRLIRAM